jgi:oligoribonuclease
MERMFWVDLEMSGLDDKVHRILEVAVVITDLDFKELETYQAIVHQEPEVLKAMDDWCTKTHAKSGLTAAVATGKKESLVEEELIALVGRHYGEKDRVVLCGNSVGNDKRFLDAYMPRLAKRLHYRIVDVSSFKEIFKSKWKVEFKKSENHRALEDARASIAEIKTYLALVTPPAPKTTESAPST